jgi:hypothetical protein
MAETDELKDALPGAAARVDSLRAAGLKGLDRATAARQASLQRERDRLAKRHGPDDPRVKAVTARIDGAAALRRDLALEVARAETVSPQVGPQEWALHGYVRWKDLSPAPDMTVSLVDEKGQWLRALGFACTDARGYFTLSAKVEHAADGTATVASAYVRVTDGDRKELYRGREPLPVLPGAVEYREIVLEGEPRVCASPEEEPQPGTAHARKPPAARGKKAKPSSG